jgi:predicted HD phosphohydrolase
VEAVALRRWDDLAKDPAAKPPDWTHFAGILERASRDFILRGG